ncbi:TnsA endonuclease N-terminal domain-containing protein [Herbaspirillum huttiense]|uniref:TnsA endonuclease N-terminal domain-containing protein n=1 Tax=Herbaspirillum huttiense TaxID=863372 RepID=UPI0031D4D960
MIHWESQLERDAVILFEFSKGVISYREQPLTTYYALDGMIRRYTPDFEITLFTGEVVLIEVKPSEKLLDPKERTRLRRIAEHFAETGSAYRILTEIELRTGDLLANLQMVFRYREAKLSPFERRKFSEQICVAEEMTFGEATALLGAKSLVWILIAEHLLFCDLRHPVTEKTVLFTGIREGCNEELYF